MRTGAIRGAVASVALIVVGLSATAIRAVDPPPPPPAPPVWVGANGEVIPSLLPATVHTVNCDGQSSGTPVALTADFFYEPLTSSGQPCVDLGVIEEDPKWDQYDGED